MAKNRRHKIRRLRHWLYQRISNSPSNTAGIDLHVRLHYGEDLHHSIEAIFKALGRALRVAVEKDKRVKGVLSTKGKL